MRQHLYLSLAALCVLLAPLAFAAPERANAAEFTVLSAGPPKTVPGAIAGKPGGRLWIALKGPIEAGDADKLATLVGATTVNSGGSPRIGLMLESNGGSFNEAIAIADQFAMTTVVDAGKSCFSACGVIFMGGRRGDEKPDRHMHASARVGFHAPFLPNIGGRFTRETLANAYLVGMKSSVALLERQKTFTLTDGWVHDMLGNGPDQFAEVRYVHHAIEYGIAVYGIKTPRTRPEEMISHLCENQIDEEQQVGFYDEMFDRKGKVIASKVYPFYSSDGVERRGNTFTLNGSINEMTGQECNARLVMSGRQVSETWRQRNVHYRGRTGGIYLLHSRWTPLAGARSR